MIKNSVGRKFLPAFLILFSAAVLFFLEFRSMKQKFRARNSELSSSVQKEIDRTLSEIELMLFDINFIINSSSESSRRFSPEITKMLVKKKQDHPYIMDILVLDSEKEIIQWTGTGRVPYVKDRDFAAFHSKGESSVLFIGEPRLSRVHSGKWFFGISYAFLDSSGNIVRIIAGLADLEHFSAGLNRLKRERTQAVRTVSAKGLLISPASGTNEKTGDHFYEVLETGTEETLFQIKETRKSAQGTMFSIVSEEIPLSLIILRAFIFVLVSGILLYLTRTRESL